MTTTPARRPIGFWLKLLDRLIDERLEVTLGGVTRRHWQVLNLIDQGPCDQAGLDEELAPFLALGGTTAGEVGELLELGWIAGAGPYSLTEVGQEQFGQLRLKVSADREKVKAGIAREDFTTTLATLERMAHNLGWKAPGNNE